MKFVISLMLYLLLTPALSQTLIIGTAPDSAPFASLADNKGHFYGFEIDLMIAICARINVQCIFKPIVVSNALTLLNTGKVDLIIAEIIKPPQGSPELKGLLFSEPYEISGGQFIVKKTSPINTLDDIRNKRVGTRRGSLFGGTLFNDYLLKMYNNQLKTKQYLTTGDMFAGLVKNEVDASFSNTETINYLYINNKDAFKLIGKPIPIGDGYSIMAKDTKGTLMSEINDALFDMENDGSYMALYQRYFTPT